MRKALVLFASTYGHTERVARRVAEILGADVAELKRFRRHPSIEGYDLVVLAGSIYFGRHQRRLERFIRSHRAALESTQSALISVSGSAIDDDSKPDAEGYVAELTRRTGWQPRRVLLAGGGTAYTRYPFFLRRKIAKASAASGRGTDITRDYDYTKWDEVESFARALTTSPSASPTAGG